ncbi:TadC Flp pilus assembly protein TadC [Burkholderiaceae bacterium]
MRSFYTVLFLAVIFILAVTIAYVALNHWMPTALDKRMATLFAPKLSPVVQAITSPLSRPVKRWIEPLASAAMNAESWLTSPLRIRFSNAGLNSPNVVTLYFASKTLLTFVLPLLVLLFGFSTLWHFNVSLLLSLMLVASASGYYLPNALLSHWVKRRQHELFRAFPDALDLLRVCVEAGLGLDAAVERVGREMQIESEALAQEFSLLGLELRAGAARPDALRNLALRIGLDDIDALVSMLIQADRFGTSVGESLKVHSESLRTKRRLIAEEAAAKLPVKILMPLIFCVFPALLTVLLGPAVINVAQMLMPTLSPP